MDQMSMGPELLKSLESMSHTEKQELNSFIQGESQKAQIQAAVHGLTNTCFRKCIPAGRISSSTLDRSEEPCMRNCVDRWMESQMTVIKHLEQRR